MELKISVIIPFHNSEDTLNKCLTEVYNSNYKNFEVIAVADNCTDNSIAIAERFSCTLLTLNANSAAATRNLGASKAKGDILLFLDSDVIINNKSLFLINEFYMKNENVHLMQGTYSYKHNYKYASSQFMMSHYAYYVFPENKKETKTLVTNFFCIKKDIFNEFNGFDENFYSSNSEDEELGYRLIKSGFKISVNDKLKPFHDINIKFYDFIKKGFKQHIGEMKLYLRKKNIGLKSNQTNYRPIIIGVILISFIILMLSLSILFNSKINFIIFLMLNLLFLIINFGFLRFVNKYKGFKVMIESIFFIYVQRLVMLLSIFFAITEYYLLRKKF